MTREELIEDIKKTVPHIVSIVGENFNWNRVAEMIEKKQINESSNSISEDEKFEEMCVCIAYANSRGLNI